MSFSSDGELLIQNLSPSIFVRVRKACNIMSQSPEGSFTMVMPHERRNCSFSIIYPVEIQLTELSLGQARSNELSPQVRHVHFTKNAFQLMKINT